MENNKNLENKKLEADLKKFLNKGNISNIEDGLDCSSGVCVIKGDKSLVERINKKIITEDGRQLII